MKKNGIDLDPDVKDRFGLPVSRVTKKQHTNDIAMYDWYEKKLHDVAEAVGAKFIRPARDPEVHITETQAQKGNPHNHGTARMGTDSSKSVVDKWCRSPESLDRGWELYADERRVQSDADDSGERLSGRGSLY